MALVCLLCNSSSLYAYAPTVPVVPNKSKTAVGIAGPIAEAQADQKAGRFAEALIRLRLPSANATTADTQSLRIAVADVQYAWAKTLVTNSPSLALIHYQAALDIDKTLRPAQFADDLNNQGIAYNELSQFSKAIDFYQQALALFQKNGDQSGQARASMNLGSSYLSLGQYSKAIDFYQQALPIYHQDRDKGGEAKTLVNLGSAYDELGQHIKAIDFYQQALPVLQQIDDKGGEAGILNNLGTAYDEIGQYDKAISFYQQAQTLFTHLGDKGGQADTFNRPLA